MKMVKKGAKKGYDSRYDHHHHHHIPANHALHVSHASHHMADFHHGGEVEIHEMDLAHADDFMHMIQQHEVHHARPPMMMMGPMAPITMGIMMPTRGETIGNTGKAETGMTMPVIMTPVTNSAMMASLMRPAMIMDMMKTMTGNGHESKNNEPMSASIKMPPEMRSSLVSMNPMMAMASERLASTIRLPMSHPRAMHRPRNIFPMKRRRSMNQHSQALRTSPPGS
ncbi:uncharacterized protein LOC111264816 isoform X2 [Varroa jacobsoni]|nr:uncharacterized protein LOC111264816 isoform X2 [Varroa jacobsoni]XP_022696732.1 uncharacterized protein LOC111264816 isoform X2 [Varroa jacobsoni]